MINLSSASAGYLSKIQNNKIKKTSDFAKNSIQKDAFISSKNFNSSKKAFSPLNIILPIAVVGVGILALIKSKALLKIQAKQIIKKAEKIKQDSSGIVEQGKKEFEYVKNVLTESKQNNFCNVTDEKGNITRAFIKGNGINMMQDIEGDKVTREVKFDSDTLFFNEIYKNVEYLENNTKVSEGAFWYDDNGGLESFVKKYQRTPIGYEKSKTMYAFNEKGNLLVYTDLCLANPEESGIGVQKCIWFDEKGKVISYAGKTIRTADGKEVSKNIFQFDEKGNITSYKH